MKLEEAIRTAITYENRVCAVYREAMEAADDPSGRVIFEKLLREEESHVHYLDRRLAEWSQDGRVQVEVLETILPSPQAMAAATERLRRRFVGRSLADTVEMLRRALAIEAETGGYYRRLLNDLGLEDRRLFERFAEIEAGHYDFVQMQIDALTGSAFWFGFEEFDVEIG